MPRIAVPFKFTRIGSFSARARLSQASRTAAKTCAFVPPCQPSSKRRRQRRRKLGRWLRCQVQGSRRRGPISGGRKRDVDADPEDDGEPGPFGEPRLSSSTPASFAPSSITVVRPFEAQARDLLGGRCAATASWAASAATKESCVAMAGADARLDEQRRVEIAFRASVHLPPAAPAPARLLVRRRSRGARQRRPQSCRNASSFVESRLSKRKTGMSRAGSRLKRENGRLRRRRL